MKTISELTSRPITAHDHRRKQGEIQTITELQFASKASRPAAYENEVFNFLFQHKDELGIRSVMRFKYLLVDGQIVMLDGKRLVVEVKLRMNWLKACQSEWQFSQFLKRTDEATRSQVKGAIVFFEEFAGAGWERRTRKAKNAWGWEAWYLFHHDAVDGKRMDLLKLSKGELRGYPDEG